MRRTSVRIGQWLGRWEAMMVPRAMACGSFLKMSLQCGCHLVPGRACNLWPDYTDLYFDRCIKQTHVVTPSSIGSAEHAVQSQYRK